MSDILRIVGLSAGYGEVGVLHGVDLTVAAGGVTALVGSNGAGKTTLFRCLTGLLPAAAGEIHFEGARIDGLPSHERVARGMVLVPEGRLVLADMSVEANLRVGAINTRARAACAETLASVYALFPRLRERRSQTAGTLSGGEQQMLALGRGLMALPRLLLLDEPTLGLAPAVASQIFRIIPRLVERGVTVLIAEQDVTRTLSCADTGFVMENGRIGLSGPGRALLAMPDIAEAFLGGGA
ncbi:MAG: ABC transporter ATP-binding protein [Alphaproteobacteria bacterium]